MTNPQEKKSVLIFIVSYNAEVFIKKVLQRIPDEVWKNEHYLSEVLIIDDASPDNTFLEAHQYTLKQQEQPITVLQNPVNQGYGGNQKLGYRYAILNKFDAVVLLHGDGQYAPEILHSMIDPIINGDADVVLGSRMLNKGDALKGKMPLYKWVGNQILTNIQNTLLGSNLAEFHTGYRAYRVSSLASVPYELNADYFDFDTDILIQMIDTKQKMVEIPIPTYYGDEISRVNGWKYGLFILWTTLQSRLMRLGILFNPKFDYMTQNEHYDLKLNYSSSHQFALDRLQKEDTVLDIGSGPGYMAQVLSKSGIKVVSVDQYIQPLAKESSISTIEHNVETYHWQSEDLDVEKILLLDIIEHLNDPEEFLSNIRAGCSTGNLPEVIITTANIAFLPIRFMLLLGLFNYGKRGILDRDHSRLFTFSSLNRSLQQAGYDVLEVKGISAPYPLVFGDNTFAHMLIWLNKLFIMLSKGLFSYQIAIVARPRATTDQLLSHAHQHSEEMLKNS